MSEGVELQLMTAALITVGFFVISLFMLRKKHMEGRATATRVGALIYGLIFAAFVSGIMVPLRLQMLDGSVANMGDTELLLRVVPTFAFFVLVIRSDITGRLPLIGTFIRAYRSAMLRRTIEGANKRLDKMLALEERVPTGA